MAKEAVSAGEPRVEALLSVLIWFTTSSMVLMEKPVLHGDGTRAAH
jgi:hypothetical protein